ncbi:MAG: hypothetical protein V3S32_02150 [Acidimicrobiia bacterium]
MSSTPDATEVDPVGHKVVFENEHVRILEVRNPTGQVIRHHSHPPRVVVAISPYRIRSVDSEGAESTIDRRPGEATWVDSEEHEAEILIGPTHVIEVEVKAAR